MKTTTFYFEGFSVINVNGSFFTMSRLFLEEAMLIEALHSETLRSVGSKENATCV